MGAFGQGATIEQVAIIVTSGGTTALSAASLSLQEYTGTATQTIVLPNATLLKVGRHFYLANRSTVALTVQLFSTTVFRAINPGEVLTLTLVSNGSSDGTWDITYSSISRPLRLFAASVPSSSLYIEPSLLLTEDGSVSAPPIDDVTPNIVLSSIDFQAQTTSGATFSIAFPASAVGFYRRCGLTLLSSGTIAVLFSPEFAALGSLPDPASVLASGLPLGYLNLQATSVAGQFKTANSATSVIETQVAGTAMVVNFASGAAAASGSGSGVGDDLDSLSYKVSVTDGFDVSSVDSTSTVNAAAGFTDSTLYATAERYYRLNYDASKTVTGAGTGPMAISLAPSFTVKIGDMLVVGSEARRITAVATQISYTIESAFTTNPAASACTISQAVYTKDLNNFAGDGLAPITAVASTINSAMVNYEDTTTLGDVIPDIGVTPHCAFTYSADGTNYTGVNVRSTALTSTMAIVNAPLGGTNLFIRFFANKTAGSGAVNLLGYKTFFHRDSVPDTGPVFDYAYLFTDGVGTEVGCQPPTVVSLKTRISLNWTYVTGVNAGGPIGTLDVYLNGQLVPRFIDGTLTPDASYTEVNSTTIDLDSDYSGFNFNVEILKRVAVVDESATNSLQLQNVADAIVGSAAQVASGQATHSTLTAAIAAISDGAKILFLRGYSSTENISLAKKIFLEGQGHTSTLNGTLTFTAGSDFSMVKWMRFGDNVVINASRTGIYWTENWLATTKTLTDNGTGNVTTPYITE